MIMTLESRRFLLELYASYLDRFYVEYGFHDHPKCLART